MAALNLTRLLWTQLMFSPPTTTTPSILLLICVHDDKRAVTGSRVRVEAHLRGEWAQHLGSDRWTPMRLHLNNRRRRRTLFPPRRGSYVTRTPPNLKVIVARVSSLPAMEFTPGYGRHGTAKLEASADRLTHHTDLSRSPEAK